MKPKDQWSYKRSPEYWPGITKIMKKKRHSNQFLPEQIKNTIYVEDYVINMYEKYQLHPPDGF